MRKPIIAGNWKMNKTPAEAKELINALKPLVADAEADVVVCPPFVCLAAAVEAAAGSNIKVGAQNIHWAEKGAFTGEVSAAMVKSTGAQYVILGHSERRGYYGETSEILNKKLALALENGLTPIYCCGEALDVREAGKQNEFVINQLEETIFKLSADDFKKLVIAYEPIWAIGTGKTATSDQAEDMLKTIREAIAAKYGKAIADETSILYGGSCNAKNAKELFAKPNIDGGLIGGASLKAEDFNTIVMSF